MADIARDADASMDASTGMIAPQITDLIAGEDIDPAAPCYIKASDNKVYMCISAASETTLSYAGFSPRAAKAGQAITLFGAGARFGYGAALTPGTRLYISVTKGRLADAPGAAGTDIRGVAQVITPTDIRVTQSAVVV